MDDPIIFFKSIHGILALQQQNLHIVGRNPMIGWWLGNIEKTDHAKS